MRALLHETMTGEPVLPDLEFERFTWSTGVCQADRVSLTAPAYLGPSLYQYMVPRKFTLTLVDDNETVLAAGPISLPEGATDEDDLNTIEFPGIGPESLYERRFVLPVSYWPMIDANGYPMPSRNTTIRNVEYGTMMKRLYQQAMSHPGGAIPVIWEPDRAGTREKSWEAVKGIVVQEAIEDISQLLGGVEWAWVPQLDAADRLSWAFITGTDDSPELSSRLWHTWQSGGEEPAITNLRVKVSPEFMNQTAIFSGGKDADRVMLARATGTDLIDAGVPLAETWDSSHSSVSIQSTLDAWAQKARVEGSAPIQYWTFDLRAERAGGVRKGDWCTIDVLDHWLVPDGEYPRRVVSISGDSEKDELSVTVAGAISW